MVRTIVTPKKQTISFEVPQSYIGKEIEVIAFVKDEGTQVGQALEKKVSFTALSLDTRGFKFDRDEANDR